MLKKILPWVVFIALFGLIIIGFALKDNMNNYLSKGYYSAAELFGKLQNR